MGEAWAGHTNLVIISRAMVFKAMSLDEVTKGVQADGGEMNSATEPQGTGAEKLGNYRGICKKD